MIDDAQANALLVDGQDAPTAGTRTVPDPAQGASRKEWYDAVSTPEDS